MAGKLTEGFRDIIELKWSEFVALENSKTSSNFDAIICALARAASKGNLKAIQIALDRLDGKVATEIEVEYPKFFMLYPNATKTAGDPGIIDVTDTYELPVGTKKGENLGTPVVPKEEPVTASLRVTLDKMLAVNKATPLGILQSAANIDKGQPAIMDPQVKSVIIAGMLKLVHDGRISAINEVLEQIDGRVAEVYKMLGDDVYINNYAEIAPAGAVKNADGIYQLAADNTTNAWTLRLEQTNKRVR